MEQQKMDGVFQVVRSSEAKYIMKYVQNIKLIYRSEVPVKAASL